MVIVIALYTGIVGSLIWGRLFFFKMDSGTPRLSAVVYDLAVTVQILFTYYMFIFGNDSAPVRTIICTVFYSLSLGLFWWSVTTAKTLDFAFSSKVGNIVTTGPFKIVRHPFYVSYILAWLGSSLLFNSPVLWITLLYLMTFYFLSASKEEKVILQSAYSTEYEKYIESVGMFLPRIRKWLPSSSGH